MEKVQLVFLLLQPTDGGETVWTFATADLGETVESMIGRLSGPLSARGMCIAGAYTVILGGGRWTRYEALYARDGHRATETLLEAFARGFEDTCRAVCMSAFELTQICARLATEFLTTIAQSPYRDLYVFCYGLGSRAAKESRLFET